MKDWVKEKYGLVIVIALMIAYSAYFSALSIQRHHTFRTYASDMGQMDQALWNTLHGHPLEDTRPNGDLTARQAPRLTDHVEPIFFPLALVYWIYDRLEAILIVQSIALALGALPIFWIARRRLKQDWAAILFAAIYLLFPALEAANLAEFHAVTFAPAPLLLAYNYAEEGAWKHFVLFALVALAVKEDIALLVLAMSVWAALQPPKPGGHSEKRLAFSFAARRFSVAIPPLVVGLASLLWFGLAVGVIVPHFSPRNEFTYTNRYSASPLAILAGLFVADKVAYVVKLLASVGFVALLNPLALVVGAPALILNLLSNYDAMYSGTYHYSAPVAPYFVLAAIGGTGVLSGFLSRRWGVQHALAVVVVPVFLTALAYQVVAGYTPMGGEYFWPETTAHQQLLERFLNQIPPEARVSTTKTLFPHVSHRRFVYRFPTVQDADYILLDVSQATTMVPLDFRLNYLDVLKQGFGVRDALDGYLLLERGLAQQELPDGFYNMFRACTCTEPEHRVTIDFDNKLRLMGFDVRQDDWQRVYLRTYWTRLSGFDNQNYALFPFYVDDQGEPRADARIPDLLIHFWYPTARWKEGEVIIAETTPMELGPRARVGVGVFFGAAWEEAEWRLNPRSEGRVAGDGTWASLGELVRQGKHYQVLDPVLPANVVSGK